MTTTIRDFNVPSGATIGSYQDNYLRLIGSSSGNSVEIMAAGKDQDIDITIRPKGLGTINLTADTGLTFPNGVPNGIIYLDSTGAANTTNSFLFTGTNLINNGTISGSAIIPTGSQAPTNGMYLSGTNTIGFATNSNGVMYIDASGKVGIGGLSTTYKLETFSDAGINTVRVGLGANSISSNTTVGNLSLNSNTSGSLNSAFGQYSLYVNTSGSQNTSIGASAGYSNTTGTTNTMVGANAMFSNTIGSSNTSVGSSSLHSNTSGSSNTSIGANALYSSTTGSSNTAIGMSSMYSNTTGGNNNAIGDNALHMNTTGSFNTSLGSTSLYNNATGTQNVGIGASTLYGITTGSYNTAIGYSAGYDSSFLNTTGNRNTFIGFNTSATVDGLTNSTAIGNGAQITDNNQVVIGNTAVTATILQGNVLIGTLTNPSNAKLVVNGLIETKTGGIKFPDGTILSSSTPGTLTVTNTTTVVQTTVDSFSASAYRSAKYMIQISSSIKHHILEILVLHDGTTVYITQYGEVYTNSSLGSFDATITSGNVNLYFTPVNSLTTIKVLRQAVTV